MDAQPLDAALRQSLDDRRLSRGERKALRALVQEAVAGPHDASRLRHRAFAIAREAMAGPQQAAVITWLEDVVGLIQHHGSERVAPPAAAEAFFSPGADCLEAVVGELRGVRRTADVCVFTITDDRITNAIVQTARRGVAVRVISDDEKGEDRGSDLDTLARARIPVVTDDSAAHMHHKFAVFDRRRLLTGSFNWTRSASRGNHENLLVTDDQALVRAYQAEFDRLWSLYA